MVIWATPVCVRMTALRTRTTVPAVIAPRARQESAIGSGLPRRCSYDSTAVARGLDMLLHESARKHGADGHFPEVERHL
jgi:hypothetical protein